MATYNQPTAAPTNKVAAGTAAGAVATIIIFVLSAYGIILPAGVESAVGVLVALVTAYLVPEKA